MPITPPRPGDQGYDGLLTQVDLPEGWYLPARFPGERPDDASAEIDDLLGYHDWVFNDRDMSNEDRQAMLDSDANETVDGRWRYVEHAATHTRVFVRLQRQSYAVPEEVRVTGVVYLPWRPGDPITGQDLRALPVAGIEAAINKRLFNMQRAQTPLRGEIVILPSGRKISKSALLTKPIGDPKKTPDFYELVALQHGELVNNWIKNPTEAIAGINGVPLATAKGWVTRARARGLLPPGRRGRAG